MYRRRPPTLNASTDIANILVLPRYCCSSVDDKLSSPPPELPLPLLSLPKLSKKFVTSSQKLFACNDVRDTGETSDDATFLVRSDDVKVVCDELALSGTNAIAPAVHSENTSARSQSESSRGTIVNVVLREDVLAMQRMTAHALVLGARGARK